MSKLTEHINPRLSRNETDGDYSRFLFPAPGMAQLGSTS